MLACWVGQHARTIRNSVATEPNFTRRGRFYHRKCLAVFCDGNRVLAVVFEHAHKINHQNTVVLTTTFIERSVVYFGMLVSGFHRNFICELRNIHFPILPFLLWTELSDFGLSFWSAICSATKFGSIHRPRHGIDQLFLCPPAGTCG